MNASGSPNIARLLSKMAEYVRQKSDWLSARIVFNSIQYVEIIKAVTTQINAWINQRQRTISDSSTIVNRSQLDGICLFAHFQFYNLNYFSYQDEDANKS